MSDRIARMEALLRAEFAPETLHIRDDSHLHVGHAGARDGAGHYHLRIVAAAFSGQSAVSAHRQIYAALAPMMGSEIHALSISASGL